MRILITTPSLRVPHGGLRVLNDWASYLAKYHQVTLLVNSGELECKWQTISPAIQLTKQKSAISRADIVIIGSPHAIRLTKLVKPHQRCFIFLQNIEHLFAPLNPKFIEKCNETYNSEFPIICYSEWNAKYLQNEVRRKGPIYYIPQGVNLTDFPREISLKQKTKTVLVEGWECTNPTKDVMNLGPKVAQKLKQEGYRVIAYSQLPLQTLPDVPDIYVQSPSLELLNNYYRQADILIKATRYDARSTSPLEAMTKGTPTVRAIIEGDDDLIHGVNSIRTTYDFEPLYNGAKQLLENDTLRDLLSSNCLEYVKDCDWNVVIPKVEKLIVKDIIAPGIRRIQ